MSESDLFENLKNPRWRLNNLYTIINKQSERIKFQENSIQRQINDQETNRNIILKARQFGVTTQESLKLLDTTLFNRNTTCVLLAHEDDGIAKIFNIPKTAYHFMPENLKPRIDRGGGSKYEMYFPEINSRFYCDLESRGDTISRLHVSEAAFMDKSRLNATLQAVPLNRKVTIETTPNGLDNFFYEMWFDDLSPYKKMFFPWFFHEEYRIETGKLSYTEDEKVFIAACKSLFKKEITKEQIAYRRFKQAELKNEFIQEYPENDLTCFIHSGRNVVDQALFTELINEASDPIDRHEGAEIYLRRDPKKTYVIGADVSQGIGADYSTANVVCLEDLEEAAFFRGHLTPFMFAKKLKSLADFFTSGSKLPLLAVELNNHGHAVLLELKENIKYRKLYHREDHEDEPGWLSTSTTRPVMIDQFIEEVSKRAIKFNSKETLKETRSLIEDKGKIQAPPCKHDDCVVSAGIAVQMVIGAIERARLYKGLSSKIRT